MSNQNIIPSYDLYKTLDNALGFELSKLEESYNPYDASLPHRHNYYEILLFKEGGGLHEIDFAAYPILKDSIHFISPEQVHLLRREKHVTGYVLSFTSEFCITEKTGTAFVNSFPFFNNPYVSPIVRLQTAEQQNETSDIILKVQREYHSSNHDKADVLFSWLSILLVTARRLFAGENISEKPLSARTELTYKFKMLVEQNFRQKKAVSDYAELLNITAGHLNDTVQKDTSRTASDIIHERIILEAKRLLYHSPKTVKEIAYELMYDDPSYFIRFFKTQTDITPEQFRLHIREKYH